MSVRVVRPVFQRGMWVTACSARLHIIKAWRGTERTYYARQRKHSARAQPAKAYDPLVDRTEHVTEQGSPLSPARLIHVLRAVEGRGLSAQLSFLPWRFFTVVEENNHELFGFALFSGCCASMQLLHKC